MVVKDEKGWFLSIEGETFGFKSKDEWEQKKQEILDAVRRGGDYVRFTKGVVVVEVLIGQGTRVRFSFVE
jgi:hypothetical protein